MASKNDNSSSHIKTLLESDDISVLPQYRLKRRQTNLIPTICFYNGSFAPIHAGHINVLQAAKQYIDSLGTHELLAAYMSPSHSGYVGAKLDSHEFLSIGHRLAMIHLAIENLDWVMVDLYETFQPHSTGLYIVMNAFMKRIRSQLPHGNEIDVFWLKGEDALRYRPSDTLTRLGFQSLYILNRASNGNVIAGQGNHEKQWERNRMSTSFPERFHLVKSTELNLSSTAIRTCASNPLVTHQQLQLYTQLDNIITYILQHHLWSVREDALPIDVSSIPVFSHKIEDLTAEHLSQMLSKSSNVSVQVISYMTERIGERRGWGGPLYRLYNIQYLVPHDNNLPQSIILKISTGIWNGQVASIEPDFYMNLAPRISHVQLPRFYYATRNSDNPRETLLLLEDLSINYKTLGQKQWLTDATIYSLIATIATVHAEFFEHPLLLTNAFAWLPSLNAALPYYQTKYVKQMSNKNYLHLFESRLLPKALKYVNGLFTHMPHLFETLSSEQYSLSHGDLWINNVLMQQDQPHRLVLIDWQTCRRANGLLDIVYLLRLLGSKRIRSIESQVLQVYHQTLMKYGISRYSLSEIREDYYSLALPFMFIFLVCWDIPGKNKLNEMICILEDIVTHGKRTKRMTCSCELL